MVRMTTKILAFGAGVLGCNLSNDLLRAGKDVTLLVRGAREKFQESGMTPEQVAQRMDVPVKFVTACMRYTE